MTRLLWRLALVALAVAMFSDLTWRKRKQERELREDVEAADRYVDIGVVLRVVVQDPDGEELIEGKPRLRVVKERRFGGFVDTRANPPRIVRASANPQVWYCSEDQYGVIVHETGPLGQLVYGSEGAGKTTALAMWHYFRWLEHLGEKREGGQTAPSGPRLKMIRDELLRVFPAHWRTLKVVEDVFVLCDGTRIQLRSTKRQSAASGSPIQGFNWSWCGRDEGQDQVDAHEDIESRGRAAKRGRYKQLITATAKDSPAWRTFRDVLTKAVTKTGEQLWTRRTLLGLRSPFIFPSFWAAKAASMSKREYQRRVLAEDVGPERQVYLAWDRRKNLVEVSPMWEDVTASELARWGVNLSVLAGHDPGSLFDVTVYLKAYRVGRGRTIWVVVGEKTTEQTTTEQHVAEVTKQVREEWRCNLLDRHGRLVQDGPKLLVHADPYGNNDSKPDASCYTVWRNAGYTLHPAAYKPDGSGPGRVPKEAGIELINTLLCSAAGERRLFVAMDETGRPVAPRLVEALEMSERDSDGKAETQRKDKADLSHWPAALRYALWKIERPKLQQIGLAA